MTETTETPREVRNDIRAFLKALRLPERTHLLARAKANRMTFNWFWNVPLQCGCAIGEVMNQRGALYVDQGGELYWNGASPFSFREDTFGWCGESDMETYFCDIESQAIYDDEGNKDLPILTAEESEQSRRAACQAFAAELERFIDEHGELRSAS